MSKIELSPRNALWLFVVIVTLALALAAWWIILMAQLVDEKVELAASLGADQDEVEQLHQQEIGRQIMVGLEGVFLLILVVTGAWLIYRSLVRSEELKFRQENFLLAATHELRTPIAAARLHLDTLQSPKVNEDRKAALLPRMRFNLDRLGRLVDDILEAARLDRSGFRPNTEKVDLTALLESSREGLQAAWPNAEIDIDAPPLPALTADPKALRRALDAVMENGIKHTDAGTPRLAIATEASDQVIRLRITDNGRGLTAQDCRRIFERFYQVRDDERSAGTGLGLYLADQIVRAHGGRMRAESPGPGQGTTIHIELPVERR